MKAFGLCAVSFIVVALASESDAGLCGDKSTALDVAAGATLQKQVAIVTGGDSGLGYETARALAKQGATVVIASHNLEKCKSAAHDLAVSTGNADIFGMALDLESFASVREFAAEFLRRHQTLSYLMNNAGMDHHGFYMARTGFELQFQVNYLGHFLLTELLLPTLRKTAEKNLPAKIVNTASSGHFLACMWVGAPEDCFKDWTYIPPRDLKPFIRNGTETNVSTYGISKFARIQHAAVLAVREAANGMKAFSTCPGYAISGMTNTTPSDYKRVCNFIEALWSQDICPYTTEEGAAVNVACALHAEDSGKWHTRYKGCSDSKPVMEHGFTVGMQKEFYDRSLHWVGHSASDVSVV
jgi:NAD(P)-dependent dehydrogenase (short-subunit alcohol dehydrogenase family)